MKWYLKLNEQEEMDALMFVTIYTIILYLAICIPVWLS